MLQPGDPAPPFSLPDADMDRFHSDDLIGQKNLVLYFYPRDDTPGCTLEALEFTDLQPEFEAQDTEVIGISMDSCVSHGAFRDKHGINVRLLADLEGEVCQAYGIWQERERQGLTQYQVAPRTGLSASTLKAPKPSATTTRMLRCLDTLSTDCRISSLKRPRAKLATASL